MKKMMFRKVTSAVMAFLMLVSLLPIIPAQALELGDAEFNPNNGSVAIPFQVQYTQEVSIEVLVNGEHFGWIMRNEELDGYSTATIASIDPCTDPLSNPSKYVDASYDPPNSAGEAVEGEDKEFYIKKEQAATEGQPARVDEDGYYTLYWTGSIAGHPVVATNPNSDQYEITIVVQPMGDLSIGYSDCVGDGVGGVIHGYDGIWPQQFTAEIAVDINYSTILERDGLADFLLVNGTGLSYELVKEQMDAISNWVTIPMLEQAYKALSQPQDVVTEGCEAGDPVNMIDGSYIFSYTDLQIEGRYPLTFKRAYNSRGWDGSLGQGFTHSFDYRLTSKNGFVHVAIPGGEEFVFLKLRTFETQHYYTVNNVEFSLYDISGGGYKMVYKRGTTYEFDNTGKLTAIFNESGDKVYTLDYSGEKLQQIAGVNGHFDLDWSGDVISKVSDQEGRSVSYGYNDSHQNLTSVTNPDGDTLYYGYDGNGYISSVKDFEGDEYLQNTYDDKGRVTKQIFINADIPTEHTFTYDDGSDPTATVLINTYKNPQGRVTEYAYNQYRNLLYTKDVDGKVESNYNNFLVSSLMDKEGHASNLSVDGNGNITELKYADGNTLSVVYTEPGNLISRITYLDGSTEVYTYGGNRRVTSYKDRNNNTTSYTYDSNGFLHTETDALSNTTTTNYDSQGRLLSTEDAEGGMTSHTYDEFGRMLTTSVKLNATEIATTKYEYSSAGKLLKETDALENTTIYAYNKNGFLTKTTDALGYITETIYGTNGQPLKVIDARGNATIYTYQAGTGLVEAITDAEGNTTQYGYDTAGRTTSITDAEGNATKYIYDSNGRRKAEVDALNGSTLYTYDAVGRNIVTKDAEGNETKRFYSTLGRLEKTRNAEGAETTYKYDYNGNLLKTTDANGNVAEMQYNALNQVVKSIDAEGNSTEYTYDKVGRQTQVKNALGNVSTTDYDLAGRTVSSTDCNNNTTSYTYDILGRTMKQTYPDSSFIEYKYDTLGRMTESYDELGNATTYTYNEDNNRTQVVDAMGYKTLYAYDKNGRILATHYADGGLSVQTYTPVGAVSMSKDANGNITKYTYDALGRVATTTDAEGGITTYTYDRVGNVLKTEKDGNVISESEYDKVYRVILEKDGLGNAASYEYDPVGNLTKSVDREGKAAIYRYNKNNQQLETEDAIGGIQKTEYDVLGRTVKSVDQNGNETAYAYDPNGNTLTVTNAEGAVVGYSYDARNQMISATDAMGYTNAYLYDAKGQLIETTDPAGISAGYTYDKNGNTLTSQNRDNEIAHYTYDNMNRLVEAKDELSHIARYEYDKNGNVIKSTDKNGKSTITTYDGLNRTAAVTNPLGSKTEYTYNYLGQVATLTVDGANGQRGTTTYAYDGAGNLLSETSPSNQVTAYTYDKEGNALTKTDELGQVTRFFYDDLHRLSSQADDEGTDSFTYDAVSNMLTANSSETGTIEFTYDKLYRTTKVVNEAQTVDATSPTLETLYAYDANGNLLETTYPDNKKVTKSYDANNQVKNLTDHDGTEIVYIRDVEGRVTKEVYPDGSTTEYDYNAAGLLTLQKEVMADGSSRRVINYDYDDNGNLIFERRSGVGISKQYENVDYTYDAAGQLMKVTTGSKVKTYEYDLAGNLLSDGDYTYTYDLQNRLLSKANSKGTTTYTYDAAGNLLKEAGPDGTVSYTYNTQNRLVKGETDDGQSSTYIYNAMGVRIGNVQERINVNAAYQNAPMFDGSSFTDYAQYLKDFRDYWQSTWETEVGTTVQNNPETVTKHYVVDYLSMANRDILVTEDGRYTQRYVYDENGKRISAEYDYAENTKRGGSGENFQSDFATQEIEKVWYRTSHLGSTLFTTDTAGEVISHTIYDPWGKPVTETYMDANFSGMDVQNNYTGYTYDEVLDIYFAQFRFYNADNHRFTQEDPIKDGDNWYIYVGNSPIIRVDYFGLDSYVFYDPRGYKNDDGAYRDVSKMAQLHATDLVNKFGGKGHTIAMSTVAQLRKDWNAMGNYGKNKIDAVVFNVHGNETAFRISSDPNVYLTRAEFNNFNKQTIGYFISLGCKHGRTEVSANWAVWIVTSPHKFDAVIAADENVTINLGSTKVTSTTGDGFKVYKWNYSTGSIDKWYIGSEFDSLSSLTTAAGRSINGGSSSGSSSSGNTSKPTYGAAGYVTGNDVRLRRFPIRHPDNIIGVTNKGDQFNYIATANNDGYKWYSVKMTSGTLKGKTGFIASNYVKMK